MLIAKDKIYDRFRNRYLLTPTNSAYRTIVRSGRTIIKRDRNLSTVNSRSSRRTISGTPISGFNGDYDPSNWTINDDGTSPPVAQVTTFDSVKLVFEIAGGTPALSYFVEACLLFTESVRVTFNWDQSAGNYILGYTLNGGAIIPITSADGSGSATISVSAGTTLCLRYETTSFGVNGEVVIDVITFTPRTTVSQRTNGSVASPIGGKWINYQVARDRNLHDVRVPNKSAARVRT